MNIKPPRITGATLYFGLFALAMGLFAICSIIRAFIKE